jgi:hypothetical protein
MTPPPDSKPAVLRSAVDRILSSAGFQRSRRLYELLDYLTAQTLKGDPESLKESVIGNRLFGRPADYSAAEDNIVRSNVRQLRLKLDEYYADEGSADELRIVVPKGSYGIRLQARAAKAEAPARKIGLGSAIGISAAACLILGLLWWMNHKTGGTSPAASLLALLNPSPGRRLLVVVPDANVQLYQRLTGHVLTLQDYLARRFMEPETLKQVSPDLGKYAGALFHSSTTEGFVLGLIPTFAQVVGPASLSVRTPDALTMKDFEGDNALLISGPFGDPWVQLFDRGLDFQIQTGAGGGSAHILNREPRADEKCEYYNFVDSSQTTVCYARLAYLPGMTPGSRVLLAGGPHAASTEAASLYLTRVDSVSQLCARFHVSTAEQLPWFELLVEARALGNSPWTMRILASRTVTR